MLILHRHGFMAIFLCIRIFFLVLSVLSVLLLIQIIQKGDCMFFISLQSKSSIYEQIRDQIKKFIKLGVLKDGDKMPSVRELAFDLGINPNTVMKAYQELENNGYIKIISKKGAFVTSKEDKDEIEGLTFFIKEYKEKGIEKEQILEIVDKVYGGEEDVRN